MSIKSLKERSKSLVDKLHDEQNKQNNTPREVDERMWTPSYDKDTKNGTCVVRFLPPKFEDELPYVAEVKYSFKGPSGKWYIENSRRMINEPDPVAELGNRLYNSGIESDKLAQKPLQRKRAWYTNVLVIEDEFHPENNGKVKIWRFGPAFFNILNDAMFGAKDMDEREKAKFKPLNPFDPWEGAELVIRSKGKQVGKDLLPNYERSSFDDPSVMGTDEFIEEIVEQTYSLKEFVSPEKIKPYEVLQKRLLEVLGDTIGSGIPVVVDSSGKKVEGKKAEPKDDEDFEQVATGKRVENKAPAEKKPVPASSSSGDHDLDFLDDIPF